MNVCACVCTYTYYCLPAKARDECARPSICTLLHFALSHFMGYIICEQPPHTHTHPAHPIHTHTQQPQHSWHKHRQGERGSAVERVSTDFILFCDVFAVDNEKSPETFCQTTMLKSGWQSASGTDAESGRERETEGKRVRKGLTRSAGSISHLKWFTTRLFHVNPHPRLASFIALFLVFCLC